MAEFVIATASEAKREAIQKAYAELGGYRLLRRPRFLGMTLDL